MARCLHLLIVSFALLCFCSANEYFAISDHQQWHPFSLLEELGSGETTEAPTTPKPVTTVTVTTATVLVCQNGGTFNGLKCICSPEYSGELCQNLETIFEPDTFNRSVEVVAEIKANYEEDFADQETDRFKEFAKNFTEKMHPYYKQKLDNLKEVVVNALRRGSSLVRMQFTNTRKEVPLSDKATAESVIVDHEVVLIIPNEVGAEDLFQNSVVTLKNATTQLVNCTECPFEVVAAPNITGGEINKESVCKSDPEQNFLLEAHEEDGKILCLTQCDDRHTERKTCNNDGKCNMVKNVGPVCMCPGSTWYLGDDCNNPIHKQAFYIGLSVTLVCLLVTVGALTAYMLVYKRTRNQKKDVKEKLVKQWLNEDIQWSRTNSAMDRHDTGVQRNDPNRPSQMRFPSPSHAAPHLDSASSASPYNNLDRQIRINRPQIRTSWDD
ncbi:mucin-17 isoform X2 [Gouania willdenowi]|uniref:mucin-17 isoform X2 n=1 Tax=Gouania willdenowi TaxID=441366 RepID=UPI0010566CCE|nr:mucin-17-like isoform X2 [Gouania willdenowi]